MPGSHPFRFAVVAGPTETRDQWVAKARRVEALGFSVLLAPDAPGRMLSPLPALAVAAAVTTTLRVGPYVLASDYRNPVLVAHEAATLDVLTDGRIELGLAAGRAIPDDYRRLGLRLDPGPVRIARAVESLRIIRKLLRGETVTAPGPHYSITAAEVAPRPVQRELPILVAARHRKTLAAAARDANLVALATHGDPPREVIRLVESLREAAGDRFGALRLAANFIVIPDDEAVRQRAARMVRYLLGKDLEQLLAAGSPIVLTGSPERMAEQLLERRETYGLSQVIVSEFAMEHVAPVVARLDAS